jgi:hypothetical protein
LVWAIAAVAVIAYLPCINNGFIADDFVQLQRIEDLKTDPFILFRVAPEIFRLTSYGVFAVLKVLAGYHSAFFYSFNILLHALNTVMLVRLVFEITNDEKLSLLASLLFAVYHRPQEAVMWIGSMNETLLFFFVALTLVLWIRRRYAWSVVPYFFALFSKESAVVVLPAVVLIDYYLERGWSFRRYAPLLVPTGIGAAVYLLTLSNNFMIHSDIHAFRWHAALVLVISLHRLIWPWAYIVAILAVMTGGSWPSWKAAGVVCLLLLAAMLPYIFLIHGDWIPNRHNYLASAVFATALAGVVLQWRQRTLKAVFVAAFIAFNIHYLWIRHDSNMERRAAPTNALIEELKRRVPGPVRIVGFAYPASAFAKAAAVTVSGWSWDQVDLSPPAEICPECVVLEWNNETQHYVEQTKKPAR